MKVEYWQALNMLKEYANKMHIDNFVFAEQTSKCVNCVIIDAWDFIKAIDDYLTTFDELPELLTMEKGEQFFRIKRQYSAVKMWQGLQQVDKIRHTTYIDKVKNMPTWKGMKARGFEVVVAESTGGQHTGDDVNNVDVIHNIYGRMEVKYGGGRLYTAAKAGD